MRQEVIDALMSTQRLAAASQGNKEIALQNAALINQILTNTVPQVIHGEPATRLVFTTTQETVIITPGAPGTVSVTSALEIAFPTTGWVKGLVATVAEGNQYLPMVSAQLRIQDIANVFTSGRAAVQCPLSLISGGVAGLPSQMMPLRRRVDSTSRWYVTYSSQVNTYPTSSLVLTPILAVVFAEDSVSGNIG